jgi:hypothetical protein
MALTSPQAWNNYTANGFNAPFDPYINGTPTAGNWLIASLHWHSINADMPYGAVGDWARNMWTLVYTSTKQASGKHPNSFLHTQIWACPSVLYTGWPNLGVSGPVSPFLSYDTASVYLSVFEVAGMTNGFLTVDSVTVTTANATTSFSLTAPTPAGGADCLMVMAVTTDIAGSAGISRTGSGAFVNGFYGLTPPVAIDVSWLESTTSLTQTYSISAAANWVGIAVGIRVTGTVITQTNPNWPVVDFQLGLGYTLSTPHPAITWTSLPNRLTEFSTERGIQFELGSVQSNPTDLKLRNDDGALSPRTAGSGTATSNGTTSTFVCSSTDSATMNVTDFFQLKTSGNALKEFSVFQVTGISTVAGTSTVTFTRADGNGNALTSTATGDKYVGVPIDIYLPFRIIATWGSPAKQYPVCSGWIERWPQTWDDPHWGDSTAVGIDVIATLTSRDYSALQGMILRCNPHSYWTLGDASGNSVAQNYSGVGTATLTQTTSSAGAGSGSAQFGASTKGFAPAGGGTTTVLGDPGSAWGQSGLTSADLTNHGYALVGNDSTFPPIGPGVTVFGVYCISDVGGPSGLLGNATTRPTVFALSNATGSGFHGRTIELQVGVGATQYQPYINKWDQSTGTLVTDTDTLHSFDNNLYATFALTFNRTSYTLYLDGNLEHQGTCNLVPNFDRIDIGGTADSYGTGGHTVNANWAHIAIIPRILSTGELADLQNMMLYGRLYGTGIELYQNAVIQRKLDIAGWTAGTRVLNRSTMFTGYELTQSTVAEQIVQLADFNADRLFADAAGQIQYRTRAIALTQTVRATLGDSPGSGEIPYVGDSSSLQIDFDPTYLYNRIEIVNSGVVGFGPAPGADFVVAQTSFAVQNNASIAKYGLRTLGKTVSFDSDSSATAVMNYYLAQYGSPRKRVSTITMDVAKSTTSFPFVLGIEVGDLVNFNRRPIGAPMISIPCVVLDIKHDVAPDKWQTTLILAPAPV